MQSVSCYTGPIKIHIWSSLKVPEEVGRLLWFALSRNERKTLVMQIEEELRNRIFFRGSYQRMNSCRHQESWLNH